MGCLDHVRGHGDQVHVTGQTMEGWSWRRWGNWPLLSTATSHYLSVDWGQILDVLSFIPAEQTKHAAHLFFSYFINNSSFSNFSFSKFAYSSFYSLMLSFSYSLVQTKWPWNPWLLPAAMVLWETALGTEPEGPYCCPDC